MAEICAFPPPPARSPRPIQQSHAILQRLIATAFEVIAKQDDDDRLAEDLVERLSMEVLVWQEEHDL